MAFMFLPVFVFSQQVDFTGPIAGDFIGEPENFVELENRPGYYIMENADPSSNDTVIFRKETVSRTQSYPGYYGSPGYSTTVSEETGRVIPVSTIGGDTITSLNKSADSESTQYFVENENGTLNVINDGVIERRREYTSTTINDNNYVRDYTTTNSLGESVVTSNVARLPDENLGVSYDYDFDCDFWEVQCHIAATTYTFMMIPAANILGAAGRLLDMSVGYTIINPSYIWGSAQSGSPIIDAGWVVFRDIANLLFIFVLLFIAIKTILNGTGTTGKQVGIVIAVAILINFSLLFTKIIIDVSNNVALSFYDSTVDVEVSGIESSTINSLSVIGVEDSLAGVFIAKSGVVTAFKEPDGSKDYVWMTIQAMGGAVLMLIMAIIVGLAALLLFTRFVVLTIVMVTSSLAFGAYMLPELRSKISMRWWSALTGQALVAPIFFAFTYIAVRALNTNTMSITANGFKDMTQISMHTLMVYLLTLSFLAAGIILAKQSGDKAGKEAGSISKAIGGGLIGASAWAGRQTAGRAGRALARNIEGNNAFTRQVKRAASGVGGASFDLRSAKSFGKVASVAGVDVGKAGGAGGFDKMRKDAVKKSADREKFYSTQTDGEKRKQRRIREAMVEQTKIERAEIKKLKEEAENMKKLAARSDGNAKTLAENKRRKILVDIANKESALKKKVIVYKDGPFGSKPVSVKYGDAEKVVKSIKEDGGEQRAKDYASRKSAWWRTGASREYAESKKQTDAEKEAKKIKQTEEDKRTEKLEKAIKDSSKKDD